MAGLALGRRVRPALNAVAARAVALVYPPVCIACGAATAAPHGLCAQCWSTLAFIERPFCDRLGTPFAHDSGGDALLSPAAIADPPVFARARAVARHDGAARDLVHRLKYGDRPDLARAMAAMMARAGAELLADCDVIVPVPLHPLPLWSRRYNQAMARAAAIGGATGRPGVHDALKRRKRTRRQIGLTRAQRAENLQGAFHVPAEGKPQVAGLRVLLVDDVLTTGATANAASRALLRGGARAVDVLAFARMVVAP